MDVVVDPVEDAVSAATCAVPIIERGHQALADPVRVSKEWPVDELVRGERDGFWELLGQMASGGRRDSQLKGFFWGHVVVRCRRIACASSSAVSTRPAATSASAWAS